MSEASRELGRAEEESCTEGGRECRGIGGGSVGYNARKTRGTDAEHANIRVFGFPVEGENCVRVYRDSHTNQHGG